MIPYIPNSDHTAVGLQPDSRERMEAALRFALGVLEDWEITGVMDPVHVQAALRTLKAALKGS